MSLFRKFYALREAYRAAFERGSTDEKALKPMIEDLAEFCRANQSCIIVAKDGHIDTHATAVAEGRREVFLRIQQTLALSDEALNKMKELEDD